jgi:4,5:9,10-diseco-3-hydroxy-5,9,17-trioxoandrosta-1(10),2-diene-4-oate hydrolase
MTATITEASTSKYVQAGKVKIHYNEVGSGPPIICLHGGGPGATGWSNFRDNVEAFSAENRVLLVDLPQWGKSEKLVITGPRLTPYGRIMNDFMEALGIKSADFVGNSFGGQVALMTAIDFPERVASAVVIGSTPVNFSLFCPMPLEGIKLINEYYKGEGPTLEKMRKLLTTLVYDASFLSETVLKERFEASTDPEIVKVNNGPRPERQDLTAQFGRIKAPVLAVWGLDDRAGALDIGLLMLRAIPNAQMHIFSKCGHWAQVEHAAEFNDLVLSFIKQNRAA